MTDFMYKRGEDLAQSPEAHHKHLHEADLTLQCLIIIIIIKVSCCRPVKYDSNHSKVWF